MWCTGSVLSLVAGSGSAPLSLAVSVSIARCIKSTNIAWIGSLPAVLRVCDCQVLAIGR